MDNMQIYNAGRSVPQEAQKEFNNGSFSGTDINPMWRIKKLTELFGPCGIGWYYEVLSERCEEHDSTTIAVVDLNLYINVDGEWSKPIYGTGGNQIARATKSGIKVSDEGYKMALTDALSVACKALGIGADIYFSKDRTKYSAAEPKQEPAPEELPPRGAITAPEFNPRQAIQVYCLNKGITAKAFDAKRKALVAAGKIQHVSWGEMTKDQYTALIHAIEDEQ